MSSSACLAALQGAEARILGRDIELPLLRAAWPEDAHLQPAEFSSDPAPVLGLRIVASRACGLSISEPTESGPRFVPHMFD